MRSGATRTIPRLERSTTTFCACARNWKRIRRIRFTSEPCTAQVTSSCLDRRLAFDAGPVPGAICRGDANMNSMRLRTKFLLSLILISSALTFATLMIVQQRLRARSRTDIGEALRNSVVTFKNFQKQREETLERSAGLLADLPNLRALMSTQDETTIQDGTLGLWRLAGSDLLALSDRAGRLVALHTAAGGLRSETARTLLRNSLDAGESRDWWF